MAKPVGAFEEPSAFTDENEEDEDDELDALFE